MPYCGDYFYDGTTSGMGEQRRSQVHMSGTALTVKSFNHGVVPGAQSLQKNAAITCEARHMVCARGACHFKDKRLLVGVLTDLLKVRVELPVAPGPIEISPTEA
jgi:hypothetical protein